MKTLHTGLGVIAGAAITLTILNSLYPDLPKRMMRDGRRCVKSMRRTVCDLGEMMAK